MTTAIHSNLFQPQLNTTRQRVSLEYKKQNELAALDADYKAGNVSDKEYAVQQVKINAKYSDILNAVEKSPEDVVILGSKSERKQVRHEVKKQLALQDLAEKFHNKEISFLQYAVKSAQINLQDWAINGKTSEKVSSEVKRLLQLEELEKKYNAGEISTVEYHFNKVLINTQNQQPEKTYCSKCSGGTPA